MFIHDLHELRLSLPSRADAARIKTALPRNKPKIGGEKIVVFD
jgi:hypothetical protein